MKTLILSFLFISSQALACISPGPEQMIPWEKLVQRSKDIVLVKVESVTPASTAAGADDKDAQKITYKFKIVETIKGKKKGTLEWKGRTGELEPARSAVVHDEEFFSKGSAGMTSIGPDCILVPHLEKGSQYLVFLTEPYHFKSFEKIDSKNDQWLKRVKAEAKKKTKK